MLTVIDIETTTNGPNRSPSPYLPGNYLVSVGFSAPTFSTYICIKHNKRPTTKGGKESLQKCLDKTTLLIGHNIKFDLSWIQECGWEYDGEIYDTMIYEYVKAGGLKTIKFGLDASCRRYGIGGKTDEIKEYFDIGIGFEDIPWKMVEQYGRNDVDITRQLYEAQQCELSS